MKFNFKKIASVLTSTLMIGSTIGLAAAANYPAPFVKNGSADVAVVWGSSAASTDLVAVTDITSDLQANLASQTATSSGSSSVSVTGGDYIVLDRSSSKLHLGAGVADVFGRSVTGDDLPNLLASGTYQDSDNTDHDYTQKVDVANMTLVQFDDSDYKEDAPTIGFQVSSGNELLNYTVDFTDNPSWDKLVDTDISLMGKSYRVLTVDNSSSAPSLTLLDSANTITMGQGDTKTVTVGNSTYDVSVTYIDSSNVKLTVNGETTKALQAGDTYKLKDGSYIGVKDVLSQSYSGGISQVEFSLGSGKLVLTDGSEVEMNDNSINGLDAFVISAAGNKLDKFGLTWNADGNTFVAPESSPVMPGFGALKFSFAGMSYPGAETITVGNDGDSAVQLQLPLTRGDASLDILSLNDTGGYQTIGKDSSHLLETTNSSTLTLNQSNSGNSFVVSWKSGKDAESYVMYASSFTDENSLNYTTLKMRNDNSYSQKVTAGDTLTLGNVLLTVGAINKDLKTVALTATSSGTDFHTLYTKAGLKIILPYDNTAVGATGAGNFTKLAPTSYNLQFVEADKDGNIASGSAFNLTLGTTGTSNFKSSVNTVAIAGGKSGADQIGSSSDLYMNTVYSALATEIDQDKGPDQHTAKITYHTGESFGELVLTNSAASVSGSSTVQQSTGVKKLGSVAVSDAEVASVASNNLIVVGGSCVNSVAAQLLGGALCGANFEQATGAGAGSFVIETFSQSSGKVATLVAGYNAADTSNAAKYLTTQAVDTTVGKKYVGSSATSAQLVTTNGSA